MQPNISMRTTSSTLQANTTNGFDLKAKVDMSLNAEAGAKLKLLGFDLAEYRKRFEIGGPWLIWEYPSTGRENVKHTVAPDYDELCNPGKLPHQNLPTWQSDPYKKDQKPGGIAGFLKKIFL